MTLNRNNLILIGVLIVQIVAGGFIFRPTTATVTATGGPLLADFKSDAVTSITITDSNKKTLTLAKDAQGQWVLPAFDNYPVKASQVADSLSKLTALDTNRLIAQNSAD